MSSLVVEFCGLPGAGKSTIAKETRDVLLAQGIGCVIADGGTSANTTRPARVARRAMATVRASTKHPLRTSRSALVIASLGQHSARDTVAGTAQWLALSDLVSRSHRRPGVHLIEEGIIQATWTLALRARHDPAPRLWRHLPPTSRSDLVLSIDVPVALADSRLAGRASRHSRTQHLAPDLRRAELERGHDLLEHLLRDTSLPVLRIAVDGQMTPSELGERAAEMVLRTVRHQALT